MFRMRKGPELPAGMAPAQAEFMRKTAGLSIFETGRKAETTTVPRPQKTAAGAETMTHVMITRWFTAA